MTVAPDPIRRPRAKNSSPTAKSHRSRASPDLAYDPTGSAVTLDNVRICPYQNSAGLEVIATVYSGSGYTDGFKMSFQIAKDSPNPADVPRPRPSRGLDFEFGRALRRSEKQGHSGEPLEQGHR
jgi:hypothetical protein